MSGEEQTRSLLQGTAILAFAAFFTKVIGVIYRIPYQNLTGDTGLYVYSQVYPIYTILLTLATAGIPVAVSKLVSERLAYGDVTGARGIFKAAAIVMTGTGVLFFLVLFFGAPWIAYLWNNDQQLTLPIRAVSFALLIVPLMAVLRGYYQGHQVMWPTGVSQMVEQIVRVMTILLGSYFLYMPFGAYVAGATAVFGAFTGSLAALAVLLFFWKRTVHQSANFSGRPSSVPSPSLPSQSLAARHVPFLKIMKKVFAYALPISLGSLVIPLFQLVDSASIPNILTWSGWVPEAARDARGLFDRGQPLVQFGAFFATAMALALVPSIAEAQAKKDVRLIAKRSRLALKLTFVLGLASSVGLFLLAEPINRMFYLNQPGIIEAYIPDYGTTSISVLAFVIFFTTLNITAAAILQGVGQMLLPARHLLIGMLVKAVGNVLLIPVFDITGAALASVIGYALATVLNVRSVSLTVGMRFSRHVLLKPLLATLLMAAAVWLMKKGMGHVLPLLLAEGRVYYMIVSLISVFTGVIVYMLLLLKLEVISRRELALIPKADRVIRFLEYTGIMKKVGKKEG